MSVFKFNWIVLFFMLLNSYCYDCRQSFDREPEERQVNPGDDAVMICRILDKHRNSQCIWQKDGKPVRIQEGKYEWSGTQEWGDCSIRIFAADIVYDDGEWRCQVTSSSFNADDALSSRLARLIVRIPPSEPRIYFNGQFPNRENELRVRSGARVNLRCESRGGNPAPTLKWFLNEDEMTGGDQRNETEVGNAKRWNAVAAIDVTMTKDHDGRSLKCVAFHDAFPRRSAEVSTSLDVLYPPSVRLEREDSAKIVEADVDSVKVRCMAGGNPTPDVVWRKGGGESILRVGEHLIFDPVRVGDGGTYYCSARNEIGASDELSVTFDVFYSPRNAKIIPDKNLDLEVGSQASLQCDAQANPPARFEWLQKMSAFVTDPEISDEVLSRKEDDEKVFTRGYDRIMEFKNVSYENEGHWVCVATNIIKGRKRQLQSSSVMIEVSGQPEVLIPNSTLIQEYVKSSNAVVKAVFCADPKYRQLYWDWGHLNLTEGQSEGRFSVPVSIPDPGRPDCHLSRLKISEAISSDSRIYFLNIVNRRGHVRQGIELKIVDPIAMSTMIGITLTALLVGSIFICYAVYTYKKRRACFKSRQRSVFADETDTQNFSISYPHQHFESSSSSLPSMPDSEDSNNDEKSCTAPTRPIPPPPPPRTSPPVLLGNSKNAVISKQKTWVSNNSVPPKSNLHSGLTRGISSRPSMVSKTPQNVDGSRSSLSSRYTGSSSSATPGTDNNNLSPAMMYAHLAFPQRPIKKKSNIVPATIRRHFFETTERIDL